MDLSSLKPAKGSVKKSTRLGRGEGSGSGGTASKGHKGAKSRSGYKSKIGFEGGQMPLQRRVPKFGFKNINRKEFKSVNLDVIEGLATTYNVTLIDRALLLEAGIISKSDKFKILARGVEEFKSKLEIKADAISKSAQKAIEDKGGKVEIV